MRLLIFTAAATLVVSGTAMADNSAQHDLHMKNLRDSGYNSARDFDRAGRMHKKPSDYWGSKPLATFVHATCCDADTHPRYMKNLHDSGQNLASAVEVAKKN